MSANVTIPVPGAYEEAIVTELSGIGEMILVGSNLVTLTTRAIVKIDKADFSVRTVLEFANDGKHDAPIDLTHSVTEDRVYVTFQNNGRLVIAEVDLAGSMSTVDVVDTTASIVASNAPKSIATESTYVVVGLKGLAGASQVIRFETTAWGRIDMDMQSYVGVTDLCIANSKIFFVAWVSEPSKLLIRADLATAAIEDTSDAFVAAGDLRFAHILPLGSEVWFSFEDINGKTWRASQSTLVVSELLTGIGGDHAGLETDGAFVWQILLPTAPPEIISRAVRINPSSPTDIRFYELNSGDGYIAQLVGDGTYLYTIQSTELITRYLIPTGNTPGAVLLSDCSITGKTIAVDKSITSTANTIIVGKDSTPFYVYKYSAVPGVPNDSCVLGSRTLQLLPGWPKLIGETVSGFFQSNGYAKGVAVDSLGNIVACAGQGINEQPRATVFIVKLTPGGTTIWQKHNGLATDGAADAKSVCVDSENNVIVVGNFWGTVNFGGGNITATSGNDVFIAKYSPTGTLIFPVKVFVPSGTAPAVAVGVDGLNNIYMMGQMSGTINFGGATLNAGASNIPFLAKFTSNGTHTMSRVFAGGAQASIGSMAVNSAGIITFCGNFFNTFDIGGGPMISPFAGAPTGFVAQYNAAGASSAHRWSKSMADADSACTALGCAMDAVGNAILTGSLSGSFDFGVATLTAVYNRDLYVAKYGPTGINLWALGRSGGPFSIDFGNSVACFPNGDVAATGTVLVAKIAG